MEVVYTIEIAARESVKDDLEKTLKEIRSFGVKEIDYGDEYCENGICSVFIEARVAGPWKKHVEFAKRFAPTVIEPVDSVTIQAKDFFEPIMKMVAQSRVLLRGSGIRIPYSNFSGPKHLSRDEIEELILDEHKYRVNVVISASLQNPVILLGAMERVGIINNYRVEKNLIGVDIIGDIGNIVMLLLYFLPVAVEPVEPIEYDLTVQEIGDVLMLISDRSREIVEIKMKSGST